jgi:hypothetical protein
MQFEYPLLEPFKSDEISVDVSVNIDSKDGASLTDFSNCLGSNVQGVSKIFQTDAV